MNRSCRGPWWAARERMDQEQGGGIAAKGLYRPEGRLVSIGALSGVRGFGRRLSGLVVGFCGGNTWLSRVGALPSSASDVSTFPQLPERRPPFRLLARFSNSVCACRTPVVTSCRRLHQRAISDRILRSAINSRLKGSFRPTTAGRLPQTRSAKRTFEMRQETLYVLQGDS